MGDHVQPPVHVRKRTAGAFPDGLLRTRELRSLPETLTEGFNPSAVEKLMCRTLLSVSWDGSCTTAISTSPSIGPRRRKVHFGRSGTPSARRPIATGDYWLRCTAGRLHLRRAISAPLGAAEIDFPGTPRRRSLAWAKSDQHEGRYSRICLVSRKFSRTNSVRCSHPIGCRLVMERYRIRSAALRGVPRETPCGGFHEPGGGFPRRRLRSRLPLPHPSVTVSPNPLRVRFLDDDRRHPLERVYRLVGVLGGRRRT